MPQTSAQRSKISTIETTKHVEWQNSRNTSRKAKKLTEDQQRELLAGLPRYSVGAQILLGETLIAPNGTWLDGHAWLPRKGGTPEERFLHWVFSVDLGKFQFKYGGVDDDHLFQSTFVIDAYVKAQAVQYDPQAGEQIKGLKSWTLLLENGSIRSDSTAYWLGEEALQWVKGKFPLSDISMRIREQRFREQYYAGMAMQLEAVGVPFFPLNEEENLTEVMERAPTNYIIAALALPHKDMKNMNSTTKEAIRNLESDFVVMRTNTATGQKEVMKGHISDTFVYDQPRGTDTVVSLQADGDRARWEDDWTIAADLSFDVQDEEGGVTARTIADPGGGDCHIYQISDAGTITYLGSWQGDGTIEVARALIPVVERNHGTVLSEAQAQQALYTKKVRAAGGRLVKIDADIASLHFEIDNLLARIDIKEEMRSSLIVCTGGGTALFGPLLKAKLEGMGLKEKKHFLILHKELAPIANAAGVVLRACLKAQARENQLNEQILDDLTEKYQHLLDSVSPRRHEIRSQISSILEQLRRFTDELNGAQHDEADDTPVLEWPILQEYLREAERLQSKIAS